jgi:CheY-like chemotaxis protein
MDPNASNAEPPHDVVAVVNTSPDTVDMLRLTLQHAGLFVVSTYTYDIRDNKVDIGAFMREHRPRVIIYDVAPPYEANWQFLLHLRQAPALQHVRWVITSTNAAHVAKLSGKDEQVYEVVGKPYDLDQIVRATKEALRPSPTR